MRTLQTISGQEYLLSDEEAEKIKKNFDKKFIQLSNGDVISVGSISKVGSLDKVKSWGGYVLRKDGRSFIRDGDIVNLEGDEIFDLIDDPKYKSMAIISIKQLQ